MSFNNQPPSGGVPPGGTTGEVLLKLSNADGDADWGPVSGTSVSSVNGQTGSVVLTTTDIAEGTRLYYTNERVDDRVAALIIDSTTLAWTYDDTANTLSGAVKWPLLAPDTVSPNPAFGHSESGNDTGWGFDGDGSQYWSCNNQEVMRLTVAQLHVEPDLDVTGNITAANYPPTGSSRTFAGFDGSGAFQSVPGYAFDATTGGMNYNITQTFGNNAGATLHNWVSDLNPTANAPDTNRTYLTANAYIDTNDDGFSFGTNGNALTMLSLGITHQHKSNTGGFSMLQANFNIGNGTDAISVKGLGYLFGFGGVAANVTIDGGVQGYGFQPNFDAASTFTTNAYFNGFYDSVNAHTEVKGNYTSFSSTPTIDILGSNINYTGLNINPNISSFVGNGSVNAIGVGGNYGTMNLNSYWNGLNVNPTITSARYAAGVNVSMDNVTPYAGTYSTLVFQDLTFTWLNTGDNSAYTMEYTPGGTAGSEVVTISGNAISVQIDSGVSTALQVKAALEANGGFASNIGIVVSGTGSNAQVTAGPTNFSAGISSGTVLAGYFDGDVQITGSLSFNGALSVGKLNAFATQALVNGTGNPSSIHSLITQPTVAANATITNGDLLGVNTASLIQIGDNATVTTAFIGVSALGLPAVLTMGTGATVDKVSGAAFALSLDASGTGGTVNEVALCRALALPNGVTTVNRLYGYEMALPFGDPGTVSWGVYLNGASQNWLAGALRIGGTAGSDDTAAAGLAFQVTGDARFDDQIGFYGTSPVAQPVSSGAQTAGGTYGATEQTMLQEVYDAVRALGLMT